MKKLLFTLILILSFTAVKSQSNVTLSCFDDAKIKTYDKHFYIPFTVRTSDGVLRTGYTGISLSHGVPNEAALIDYISKNANVSTCDVQIGLTSDMSCADYHAFFKNKYGKIIMNK